MKYSISRDAVTVCIVTLLMMALIVSLVSFRLQWGQFPDFLDVIFSVTLLLPFALPQAFSELLNLGIANSGRWFIMYVLVYWLSLGLLLWCLIKTRHLFVLLLFAIVLLLSAINWQISATGMLGI